MNMDKLQLKRKAECPFFAQLHRWLLFARQRFAIESRQRELLALQAQTEAGTLSREGLQAKVRNLLPSNEAGAIGESDKVHLGPWHHATSVDGKWEALAAHEGNLIEMLLREIRPKSGRILTFRYRLRFRSQSAAKVFLFALMDRFVARSVSLVEQEPPPAWESLQQVCLCYSPAEPEPQKRWDDLHSQMRQPESRTKHESFVGGIVAFQRRWRGRRAGEKKSGPVDATMKAKKKKRKKKKKRNNKGKKTQTKLEQRQDQEEKKHETFAEEDEENDDTKQPETELSTADSESLCSARTWQKCWGESESGSNSQQGDGRGLRLLSEDIEKHFLQTQDLIAAQTHGRRSLVWRAHTVLMELFPCAQLHLFGSYAHGLALPESDVDLYYFHRNDMCTSVLQRNGLGCSMAKLSVLDQLHHLQNHLRQQRWVKSVKFLRSGQMPLLRVSTCLLVMDGEAEETHLTHADHSCPLCCEVDLSCAHSEGHSRIDCSELLVQEQLKFPELKPLVLLLKEILLRKGLLHVFHGGLSSLSLSLMVLRYLQHMRTNPVAKTGSPFLHEQEWMRQHWPDLRRAPPSYVQQVPFQVGSVISTEYHRQLVSWPSREATHAFERINLSQQMANPTWLFAHERVPKMQTSNRIVDSEELGSRLMGFLRFFGYEFEPARVGISVINEGRFYELPSSLQPLHIELPTWPSVNVASASFRIGEVLAFFRDLYTMLQEVVDEIDGETEAEFHNRTTQSPSLKPKTTPILRKIFKQLEQCEGRKHL